MAEIEVPNEWTGKDLKTLDLRGREKLEVLLVRRHSPDKPSNLEGMMPSPDIVLRNGDVVLISGPKAYIEKLANR